LERPAYTLSTFTCKIKCDAITDSIIVTAITIEHTASITFGTAQFGKSGYAGGRKENRENCTE
jgi:hypothetical protein